MENITVEVSARHVHLSREDVDTLFGKGYELTFKKELSQPGEFASEERVTVVGPKKSLERVSVLGPIRPHSQVELSKTDCFAIGAMAPIKESGDLEGTPGVEIKTEKGSVTLDKGFIVAKRHIHMTPADAEKFNVSDKQIVSVKVETEGRTTVFDDTIVRVKPNYSLAFHVDTDEGNAANISNGKGIIGQIVSK